MLQFTEQEVSEVFFYNSLPSDTANFSYSWQKTGTLKLGNDLGIYLLCYCHKTKYGRNTENLKHHWWQFLTATSGGLDFKRTITMASISSWSGRNDSHSDAFNGIKRWFFWPQITCCIQRRDVMHWLHDERWINSRSIFNMTWHELITWWLMWLPDSLFQCWV